MQATREVNDLQARLEAQMFLAESGWRCRTENGPDHEWKMVEVFVAVHDLYPEQRAHTVSQLVRRCAWEEANRPVPRN
jgi:hypothetical protein